MFLRLLYLLMKARELLAISDELDGKIQIADLIVATIKNTKALPEPEEVRRKIRTGQDLDSTFTMGEWLEQWLVGRKKLRANTRRSYESRIRRYLAPIIGHIRLDRVPLGNSVPCTELVFCCGISAVAGTISRWCCRWCTGW